MMLRVHGDDISAELAEMEGRARDTVQRTNDEVLRELVAQNERASFDPMHPDSIIERRGRRGWRIGSTARTYGDVLRVDDEAIADIIEADIVKGFP